MDNSNIMINELSRKYNNVIHKINTIEYDISLLCHAYNLIASISSFCLSALKLNDNLKDLWEYDIMRLYDKFLNLHHHTTTFNIKYKIHTMKPSDKYINICMCIFYIYIHVNIYTCVCVCIHIYLWSVCTRYKLQSRVFLSNNCFKV